MAGDRRAQTPVIERKQRMSRFFGDVAHQAYVFPDFDAGLAKLLAGGIGPVFVLRRIRGAGRYRGERHDALISAAFAYSGDTLFEILTPHDDVPSAYREFLAKHPDGGLQHIAYLSSDFAASIAKAAAAGTEFNIVQEYIYPDSGEPYEIYMEPVGADDAVQIQLLQPGPLEDWFGQMHAISRDWDGTDPIRDALLLMPADMRPVSEPA
jgi:catechol 2,3-dioxygenase-like lactoylglutathione lyase family enzyme